MSKLKNYWLIGSALTLVATSAYGRTFAIASGDLDLALNAYQTQSGRVLAVADDSMNGIRTAGVRGELSDDQALIHLLKGTGFTYARDQSGVIAIVPQERRSVRPDQAAPIRIAAAAAAGIESVVVTSSKIKGDIQTVPIAITALSQEQLTSRQIAGGPDLVKEVPNLTFSKTNFTGYNIQIRGIGTQAISVATDPAVAVALNDTPFIRNHFFEQEFYDVGQVEVLRGPQGTLYGRNATAGVVNVISAKPTDQFEAMLSADWGNFHNRRYEGMVNIPVVDDRLDIRVAGEWTKRNGYSLNTVTNSPIDGRDLWSSRVTIGLKPTSHLQMYLVWEHFSESDDRLRTSKQLCQTDNPPDYVDGVPVPPGGTVNEYGAFDPISYLSQGCKMGGLYSKGNPSAGDYGAFGVPDGYTLPYVKAAALVHAINATIDPYAGTSQSTNLRDIESAVNPRYTAKNDTLELNADYTITPALTFTSQTGYNQDFLFSTEDYNRFNTSPGLFILHQIGSSARNVSITSSYTDCGQGPGPHVSDGTAYFDDPQIGCSNRLVAVDLSDEHAWQLSQEFRLASNFSGPLNFSIGGNFMHYETEENYYVFINTLTLYTLASTGIPDSVLYVPNVSDNHECLASYGLGFQLLSIEREAASAPSENQCNYIDPNPINSVNNNGHNYFLSQNPYVLNSYAGFGEAYYQVVPDLKLIGGLRWTSDHKHFTDIPSEVLADGWGYPSSGIVDQQWNEWTGRFAANWTPKLDFTDQTLVYGSYSRGYKAGGANPPGAVFIGTQSAAGGNGLPIHPLTFKPEFVDAFELGTKNTLLDGALTLNGDVFFYNYKSYQISRIVDRTAINDNFDARVKGAELEAMWQPVPGLKFNFAGGYEDTRINNGQSSIDLMDRTAGNPDWIVVKPYPTQASNCILPTYLVGSLLSRVNAGPDPNQAAVMLSEACRTAYTYDLDPWTFSPYQPGPNIPACIPPGSSNIPGQDCSINGHPNQTPPSSYIGFDPAGSPAINNGEGFAKPLGGNQLPNAPHFTTSFSGEYTMPVSADWAATLHGDFYWQSQSMARVFNDRPYDKIRGYSTTNLALILTSASGWQVMGYVKNIFDVTAITGDFLNSDDSGLTTNVFLTDPRLFGVRVTKNW